MEPASQRSTLGGLTACAVGKRKPISTAQGWGRALTADGRLPGVQEGINRLRKLTKPPQTELLGKNWHLETVAF